MADLCFCFREKLKSFESFALSFIR